MSPRLPTTALACLTLLAFPIAARAASGGTALTLAQSGYLLDSTDQGLDATVDLSFRLFDDATAGNAQWEGACAATPVSQGYYAVVLGGSGCTNTGGLGDSVLDTSDLPAGQPRWLEVRVDLTTLAPRLAVTVAPRAISDVAGLQAALDAKASATHQHDSTYAKVDFSNVGTLPPAIVTQLQGPPGAPGAQGAQGPQGPAGSNGAPGPAGNPFGGGTFTGAVTFGTNDAVRLPLGTTAERPTTASMGMMRFNTTLLAPEFYDGTQWTTFSMPSAFSAVGGNVTSDATHRYHTFLTNGTFQVLSGTKSIEVLVVGGGGGGGKYWSAGGGAGGGIYWTGGLTVGTGSYAVVVGLGGAGSSTFNSGRGNAQSGGNSSFHTYTALGGGWGASYPNANVQGTGGDGGSGGGAAKYDPFASGAGGNALQPGSQSGGYGFGGGTASNYGGGGGGGAGGAGGNGQPSVGGAGGAGRSFTTGGSTAFYGGGGGGAGATPGAGGSGGGGAGATTSVSGTNGVNGTGGGGGGGGTGSQNDGTNGGTGGSGVVIVKYPL